MPASGWLRICADAQLAGHGAGVLRGRAAERDQHVVARVVALGDRDRADRLDHVGVGHPQEAVGQFVRLVAPAGRPLDLRRAGAASRDSTAAPVQRERETARAGSCPGRSSRRSRPAGRRGRSRPGPGSAPALSGPTASFTPSNRQIDPPPAATVSMAIIGATTRTPAFSVSYSNS